VTDFGEHLEEQDIRHVYIRPRTPHLNGKGERSHRLDQEEFYQLLDKDGISDDIRLFNDKLREWEDYYNYHRPHGALDGQTPFERPVGLVNFGAFTSRAFESPTYQRRAQRREMQTRGMYEEIRRQPIAVCKLKE
jgi:hypothetical protein